MPKIGNSKPNSELPCDRCGSKRRVSKSWTEKIKNSSGFMVLEHLQIICTDKVCQAKFEKTILEEIQKREKLKQAKTPPSSKKSAAKATA